VLFAAFPKRFNRASVAVEAAIPELESPVTGRLGKKFYMRMNFR
jgi:hypothetical protein